MVWYIVSIKSDDATTTILFKPGTNVINPTGSLHGNYVLGFPNLGYVTLTDNGNKIPGWDWSVTFSGATNGAGYWFYSGDGKAEIQLDADGTYTVSGDTGAAVQGKLTSWPV